MPFSAPPHWFSVQEMERVFTDSIADQSSAKDYLFHESKHLTLTGHVDECEPESFF